MSPTKQAYKYDVAQCSVLDTPLLTEFRAKRTEWIGWLEDDPDHSIWGQIHRIMWNDAVFRALNEARRFGSNDRPTASLNGMLGEFLDRGYVATQVLDICRITDQREDVVSLRRLVNDLAKHRHLISRENFVAYDGLPYDYATVQQAYLMSLTPDQIGKVGWVSTEGPDAWGTSERMHIAFDKLSGVTAGERTRKDLIHENVFATLNQWLDAPVLKKLRIYRNKYLGHAADATSRKDAPLSKLGFSLNEFAEAQRVIIRVATAIGSNILYETALGSVVPIPQMDVYKHLELPVLPAAKKSEMGNWWQKHSREREEWLRERFDLITGDIKQS